MTITAVAQSQRSLHPEVIKSHIQKLRSFRYQMKSTLAGDNLDTLDELAQKGILSNGELGMSLEHHRNGSISLGRCDDGDDGDDDDDDDGDDDDGDDVMMMIVQSACGFLFSCLMVMW